MIENKPRSCCSYHWNLDHNQDVLNTPIIEGVLMHPVFMPMILCQVCGNKRCPKATDCSLLCTESNEPGQIGSAYQ